MLSTFVSGLLGAARAVELPKEVLVYGAGGAGKRVAGLLREKEIRALALLDRKAAPGARWNDLPVIAPQAWRETHPGKQHAVVIGIHSPGHDLAALADQLRAQEFGPVFTMVDLCNLWPEALADQFWLAPRSVYARHLQELDTLHELLADDGSRELLRQVLKFRITGDYAALPQPEGGQYCPASLPRWPQALRLIDCGAFTGDTLDALIAAGYGIEAAACLEPDPVNFAILARHIAERGIPAICLPCAASSEAGQLRFSAEGAGSSHLQQDGGVLVQAISLDQSLAAFAPNLIKMDIEGAEIDALHGARATLAKYRPGLALSIYHRAEHLWQIPLLVQELLPDASLSIRPHAYNSFDLVLYARPRH